MHRASRAKEEAAAATPPLSPETVIEAHGLTRTYGELVAVDHLEFAVRRGEVFGVLGPNGAGKTTLVEMLEGLNPPTAGSATVLGLDIRRDTVEVKERIGVQLQASTYHGYLTLREILELFGSFYRRAADPDALLERVELTDRADARIAQLSGGLAQRFSIVAALVNEPELVFFDEPTAGLDPDARRSLWALIREVQRSGATVVLTTHYMEEAQALCDRVAILDRGRIVALDTPDALIRTLHAPHRIRLTTTGPLPREAVEGIDGVTAVEVTAATEGHLVTLRAAHGPQTAVALAALVVEAGTEMTDLAVEPATLEDVFLALTGRGLREEAATDPAAPGTADGGRGG